MTATAPSCVRQSIKSDPGLQILVQLPACLSTKILPSEFTSPLSLLKGEMSMSSEQPHEESEVEKVKNKQTNKQNLGY